MFTIMRLPKLKSKINSWFLLNFSGIVIAATVVSAVQVADAIRNSPSANAWLRDNADSVGRLAMFESSGRLDVYNGSCCYGVLQMNNANIRAYAGVSPAVFQTWSLDQQVNAWSQLTVAALAAKAPTALANMNSFDGRAVNGEMVLSCVQLGIGNCQRMINSGSCNGFADINGTTICSMADQVSAGAAGPAPVTPSTPKPTTPSTSSGGTYKPSEKPCISQGGDCLSATQAMEQGFNSGSGVSMAQMRKTIIAVTVSLIALFTVYLVSNVWINYSKGIIEKAELVNYVQKSILLALGFFVFLSLI